MTLRPSLSGENTNGHTFAVRARTDDLIMILKDKLHVRAERDKTRSQFSSTSSCLCVSSSDGPRGQNANRLDLGTRACTKHAVVLLLQHTRAEQREGDV